MDPRGWKKAAKLEAETRYQGARGDSVLERRRSLNEDQLRGERRGDADPREIFRRRCRGEREKDGQSLRHSTTSKRRVGGRRKRRTRGEKKSKSENPAASVPKTSSSSLRRQ